MDALRRMPPEERRELAPALAAIELPHPGRDPRNARRRRLAVLMMMGCCLVLAGWIAIMVLTSSLPRHYTSSHWRAVWVGLDAVELSAFAVTAWAAWRQRQVVIACMIFTGTLLIGDAWFDLALDYGSSGFTMSLILAVCAELPLAVLLFAGARRLVRITLTMVMRLEGVTGQLPSMWRIPLFADGLEEALHPRLRQIGQGRSRSLSQTGGLYRHKDMSPDEMASYRPLMFSIAYRMTGSVGDAEDIVQDALIKASQASAGRPGASQPGAGRIESPEAYLTTVTTRLAIDHLRSARVRRESYVGMWLPEPLLTDASLGPQEHAEMADSLSMAFLLLLESLSPAERAVFLLREVFGYGYQEIAEATGKSEQSCRQLFARGRRAIGDGRPRFDADRAEAEELTALFLNAADGGDVPTLIARLAPDVAFFGDSGGRGEITIAEPIYGRDQVAKLITAQISRATRLGTQLQAASVNGQPGILSRDRDGDLIAVVAFDVLDGLVQAIRVVANPDKLAHLGPVSRTWHEEVRRND